MSTLGWVTFVCVSMAYIGAASLGVMFMRENLKERIYWLAAISGVFALVTGGGILVLIVAMIDKYVLHGSGA